MITTIIIIIIILIMITIIKHFCVMSMTTLSICVFYIWQLQLNFAV